MATLLGPWRGSRASAGISNTGCLGFLGLVLVALVWLLAGFVRVEWSQPPQPPAVQVALRVQWPVDPWVTAAHQQAGLKLSWAKRLYLACMAAFGEPVPPEELKQRLTVPYRITGQSVLQRFSRLVAAGPTLADATLRPATQVSPSPRPSTVAEQRSSNGERPAPLAARAAVDQSLHNVRRAWQTITGEAGIIKQTDWPDPYEPTPAANQPIPVAQKGSI